MFTAILIDDERWALESLFRAFPWEKYGFSVVGRYTDALDGWEAIRRRRPDVVFVDNCMPEKCGLDMAEEAKRMVPAPLFIIVSGHSDFHYVRKALQLDLFDYCLKPVGREEAAELLARLSSALRERRVLRAPGVLERIQNGMGAEELFDANHLPHRGECWCAAVVRYAGAADVLAIQRQLEGRGAFLMYLGSTKLMLIVNGDAQIGAFLVQRLSAVDPEDRLMIGLSRVRRSGGQLWQCICEARSCAYCDFIHPDVRLVAYRRQESERVERYVAMLIETIGKRDGAQAAALIRQMPGLFRAEGVQMHSLCKYWVLWMNAFRQSGVEELSLETEWISEPEDMYMMLNGGIEGMVCELETCARLYAGDGSLHERPLAEQNFAQIVQYVDEHYRERLKLDMLAKRFHLNMAYCSEVFKKLAGMTFTDYMTKLRMEYAHRKIAEGGCDLQNLALEVGYGDYFAFSKRFKKYYGISPSQLQP